MPPHVLQEELKAIAVRRRVDGGRPNTQGGAAGAGEGAAPDTLVGLALSGGGIRSAAFNLGVLQSFFARGLLRHIDYLSTVSGGGYIGSWFSSRVHAQAAPLYDEEKSEIGVVLAPQPGGQPYEIRRLAKKGKYLDRLSKAWNHFTVGFIYNNIAIFSVLVFFCLLIAYCWRALDSEPVTRALYRLHTVDLVVPLVGPLPQLSGVGLVLKETVRPFLPFFLLATFWVAVWSLLYWHHFWTQVPTRGPARYAGWAWRLVVLLLAGGSLAVAGVAVLLVCAVNDLLYETDPLAGVVSTLFWAGLATFLGYEAVSKSGYLRLLRLVMNNRGRGTAGSGGGAEAAPASGSRGAPTGDVTVRPTRRSVGVALAAVSDKLFVLAVVALAIGVAANLAIPVQNMARAGAPPVTVESTSSWTQRVIYPLLGLLLTALTPFLQPRRLLRSGLNPQNAWEGWVFTIATTALLFGVPLSLIWLFARHDFARTFSLSDPGENESGQRWLTAPYQPDRRKELEGYDIVDLKEFKKRVTNEGVAGGPAESIRRALDEEAEKNEDLKTWWTGNPTPIRAERAASIPGYRLTYAYDADDERERRKTLAEVLNRKVIGSGEFAQRVWQQGTRRPPDSGSGKEQPSGGVGQPGAFDQGEMFRTVIARHPNADRISTLMSISQARQLKEVPPELNRLLLEAYYGQIIHRSDTIIRPNVIGRDQEWRQVWLRVTGVLAIVCCVVVSLNATSMHGFYRDRLAETFLVEPGGPLGLAQLDTTSKGAPYHLLSATVSHRSTEEDPSRQDPENLGQTRTEGFLFSPRYCGADGLGYEPTDSYWGGRLTLADAMTISGAAVSPFQVSSWFIIAVMVVANARTGQWLPRPRVTGRKGWADVEWLRAWAGRSVAGLSGPSLLGVLLARCIPNSRVRTQPPADGGKKARGAGRREREDLRALHFLTDGGHHENLGLWPLLERRCRLIFVSDASEDRTSGFADLLRVIRRARIERGIRITAPTPAATAGGGVAPPALGGAGSRGVPPGRDPGLSEVLELLRSTEEPTDRELKQREAEGMAPRGFRRSVRHFFVAEVRYPGDERPGHLVYLKPTLTGDEDADLQYYATLNRDFPHHPTADQLYDEDRFESYRQLGEHIGDQLCGDLGQVGATGVAVPSPSGPPTHPATRLDGVLGQQAAALDRLAAEKSRRREPDRSRVPDALRH